MTHLSQSVALNSGAELWLVPDHHESSWTGAIDWVLNFALLKSLRHRSEKISDHILHMSEATEFPVQEQKTFAGKEALLISAEPLVSSRWVLYQTIAGRTQEEWIFDGLVHAHKIKCMSLRIFIPRSFQLDHFLKSLDIELKKLKLASEISYVTDNQGLIG